ncbi:MAG: hypothetical protein A2365_03745 [Candidatus Nealsonbacteria bacterium RIFOXYB1_FULL_40_15]|uniref:Peptidoglycan recognition protein family domain-containing protein n=2 Tax=Candidatus Nealsoniibacteriota TaxID=1817911 RepID=A0A1G2EST2_9BACT|nr:MAG: hypothetical protein A2365_03745 [Candidatus Nealsonbacteria bacterium RIFOXYB1_FULL_40_15]OGZ28328.1 MAG: hypothetical protein A2427_00250 [Candidatus Nealsonbacteria bacterium RIFOXYC1_FULL_40_7]OGZ29538.1 MAG: hypothetical protein A2562_02515 [Candidatus Nealsonbacteria bacterium RIFOXYD1_FULL_39_11]
MKKIVFFLTPLLLVSSGEMKDRKNTEVLIIHHSDTEEGNVEAFRRFHKDEYGWPDVGYHFVVTNGKGGEDGQIQIGRSLEKIGAHAKARGRNSNSVGICLVGENQFTEKQIQNCFILVAFLCHKYGFEPSEKTVQRHHEKCPGPGLDLQYIIENAKWYKEEYF